MARIRSIKPEFWIDAKIGRLSDHSALFFIGLWTFSDDYGYFSSDTLGLSQAMPRWRPQSIQHMLRALSACGLVSLSTASGVGKVTGWGHQKIRDRRPSKWNDKEIIWDDAPRSTKKCPGEDRIGEDRIGEDILPGGVGTPTPGSRKPVTSTRTVTLDTWKAYSDAYKARYGVSPVRNATVNSQLAAFVKRIGSEEAPMVAASFVAHNDQFYVKAAHPVGLMLRDAEKLRMEWATGSRITTTTARNLDRRQSMQDVVDRVSAAFAAEGGSGDT